MPESHPLPVDFIRLPQNFDEWTAAQAIELARAEGIELTDEHWQLVRCVRNYCAEQGTRCSARQILKVMISRVNDRGGRSYLYRLFPRGPVIQASRIAGIPLPSNALDPSFGSVY